VRVVDGAGAIRARFEIADTGKTFTGLVKRLTKLGVADVRIERRGGPLVEALLDAGLLVVVIMPRQVKGLRTRYTGSGAEFDAVDVPSGWNGRVGDGSTNDENALELRLATRFEPRSILDRRLAAVFRSVTTITKGSE
jgi:hypothetical protein